MVMIFCVGLAILAGLAATFFIVKNKGDVVEVGQALSGVIKLAAPCFNRIVCPFRAAKAAADQNAAIGLLLHVTVRGEDDAVDQCI